MPPTEHAARCWRIGSLFSGYGGLDLAAEQVTGARTVWHAETDPAASRVLARHWPEAINHGDVTAIDWHAVDPVDILTGGTPCQDLSPAGLRAGMAPGTRSGLWASMRQAIATLRPRLVIWENVHGALSADPASNVEPCPGCMADRPSAPVLRALGRVLGDLATLGYDAQWTSIRASDIGAPHHRARIFLTAHPHRGPAPTEQVALTGRDRTPDPARHRPTTANPDDHRRGRALSGGLAPQRGSVACPGAGAGHGTDWGIYAPAITRWEHLIGRPEPAPTAPIPPRGLPRLTPAFVEWMMGLPAGWVTDTPGVTRAAALRMLGNGVVPAQAAAGLAHLLAPTTLEVAA